MNIAQTTDKTDGNTIDDNGLSDAEKYQERPTPKQSLGRDNMRQWLKLREANVYQRNSEFQHTLQFHLGASYNENHDALNRYGAIVPKELDAAVSENDYRMNNPRIDAYNGIGDRIDRVVHHPDYTVAGDYIYGTGLVKKLATLGGLKAGMAFYYLSNHVGEAGHTCPVICNYETARVLKIVDDFPEREHYIEKLEQASYRDNFTSSQFLTEVQGGSDLGANDIRAWQDAQGQWFIRGEKWFCSNANAELMVISARRSLDREGTKGLSMFLVPSHKPDGSRNNYTMRRLKEKLGTKALASAEMDYHDAYAIPLGADFNLMLERVVHHSRIALAVAVSGMTNRALQFSLDFAKTRTAFGQGILNYPLVKENLAHIKADNLASVAGTYALIALQDQLDVETEPSTEANDTLKSFSRLMVNIGKSIISKRSVDNIHHSIDGIGGNGAIENMSSLPRLFRDAVIFENWEGTHNTLYMQVLRDIHRYQHDQIYCSVISDIIKQLPPEAQSQKDSAQQYLDKIQALLEQFQQSNHDLQTLIMQDICSSMANLYYYLCLVIEGLDYQQGEAGNSKLAAAELFNIKFMNSREIERDAAYLQLCEQVLQE